MLGEALLPHSVCKGSKKQERSRAAHGGEAVYGRISGVRSTLPDRTAWASGFTIACSVLSHPADSSRTRSAGVPPGAARGGTGAPPEAAELAAGEPLVLGT